MRHRSRWRDSTYLAMSHVSRSGTVTCVHTLQTDPNPSSHAGETRGNRLSLAPNPRRASIAFHRQMASQVLHHRYLRSP